MRRHRLVHENDAISVWEIEWPPGTGLNWHNHGRSHAKFHVLEGELTNWSAYTSSPDEHPEYVTQTRFRSGMSGAVSTNGTHRVVNTGTCNALSLHFYTPKLITVYEPELEIVDWGLTTP